MPYSFSGQYYTGGLSPIEVAWPGQFSQMWRYQKADKITYSDNPHNGIKIGQKPQSYRLSVTKQTN